MQSRKSQLAFIPAVAVLLQLIAPGASVAAVSKQLTLREVIEISDRKNIGIRVAESNIAEAQAAVDLAHAGFWPELDAGGILTPDVGGGTVDLRYSIYNGGLTTAKSRLAENEKARSEVELGATLQRNHLQVIQSYYGIAQLKQRIEYHSTLVAQYAELADYFRKAFARGAAAKQDALLSDVAHRRALLVNEKMRNDLKNSTLAIQNLLQDPSITPEAFPASLPFDGFSELNRGFVARQVVANSKKLESAKMGQPSLDATRDINLAPFKIQVYASAGYTWNTKYSSVMAYTGEDLFGTPLPQWRTMLGIRIPIFKGFSSLAIERSFAERQKQFDLGLISIRSGLDQQIETQLNQLEFAKTSIEEADRLVLKSNEAWVLLRQEFKLGTVLTAFVYIQALEELGTLNLGRLSAISNYLTIRDGLQELMGQLR